MGIRFGLPGDVEKFLAVDIGGGSTEFILADSAKSPEAVSLDLGVVRLTERFFVHDPPMNEELKAAEKQIVSQLEVARKKLSPGLPPSFVGTAGTITTLAAMDLGLTRYNRAKVHNYVLALDSIRRLEHTILEKASSARVDIPGLEQGREQVIAAGTVILRKTMEFFGYTRCLVSDFGLREGVLVERAVRGQP